MKGYFGDTLYYVGLHYVKGKLNDHRIKTYFALFVIPYACIYDVYFMYRFDSVKDSF